ncbi:hypothetical protein HMPREF9136_2213 [Prevotella dentalis DSM 3688]|uniref:Uncharacterized protein n=1 Tax=Prevotella dentalis (strain ATCC 49559 / DSM 3688 / JCM 13448 / NCTC 12043 / ES 2772) TaxID=908937 RepID=F9D5T5_PREDD|nr:hypothetical protein HMPREF9136_2213 [Prevotella dentalis DSM 3688]
MRRNGRAFTGSSPRVCGVKTGPFVVYRCCWLSLGQNIRHTKYARRPQYWNVMQCCSVHKATAQHL